MNDDQLNQMLQRLASEPLQKTPLDLEQRVLREIHLRQETMSGGVGLSWMLDHWLMPRFVFTGLALALLPGVILGSLEARSSEKSRTLSALQLHVFTIHSPNLPSTLLAENP